MLPEVTRHGDVPAECTFHLAVIDDPDHTDHDLNMAAKHAFDCDICRPRVSDKLIARAERLQQNDKGT